MAIVRGKLLTSIIPSSISKYFRVWASHWADHWVECITSSYYGQLHGHSEREIMLASAELREQNRESHVRTVIDAKRLADFLAKSRSAHIEHKGGKWVFSELKNEPILSHFYCIISCLVAHCLFGRFFWAFFPLY